ncbi:hypothetical protein [Lentzea sp. NBRC 102530]|uniref:hypothetical protein n=1 Tax=Lentzea sp. NBRC 102530 TaxID=3032201 RepID=UPI0024A07808|nr:hypothetical protein [Lentzea sp. NBRC 102530]GLY53433.1 hypothetical protein Lesp01_70890 [Lentzea sp. NBRC 102530]
MYDLQAAIAPAGVLGDGAVPLAQGLELLPLPDGPGEARPAEWSTRGPVALVDAEYFGGVGTQRAEVWDQGHLVLGPLVRGHGDPPPDVSPISLALRRLGAVRGEHLDEFDAVGLGRHRDTSRWVTSAD